LTLILKLTWNRNLSLGLSSYPLLRNTLLA
jgi:hypothetical protein